MQAGSFYSIYSILYITGGDFYTGAVKFIHKGIIDGVSFGDSMLYFFKGAKNS